MKCPRFSSRSQRRAALATTGASIAAALMLVLAGCGESSSSSNATSQPAVAEVRGAPIKTLPEAATAASATASNPPSASAAKATPTPTPAAPAPASTPVAPGQPVPVSFEKLAGYTFEVSDELLGPVTNDVAAAAQKTNAQIPETVKAFDRKKVALRGFMLPLKVEGGLVTEMLIMKDQSMCCYGTTPRINDWVSVKMKDKGVRPTMDLPVTLFGTMKVGEMRENGYLVGIYSMDGETMDAPVVE
jgi:hypothetical protein